MDTIAQLPIIILDNLEGNQPLQLNPTQQFVQEQLDYFLIFYKLLFWSIAISLFYQFVIKANPEGK